VFVEVQRRPPSLLIVGAGHVAQPLASLGKLIEFEVAVLDDRPQYANAGRFPQADRVVAASFQSALRNWPIEADTFIVLVTRGHAQDVECLLEVLNSPARYIGMIGSRRRVRAVFELLASERGIPAEAFRRVYAPIGLDIEAYTPAEIAVSIIAEVIKVYRGGTCPSLSDALRKRTPTS
jgi:xanthine dehydrogenase accessory factor